jgi:hypothetical protein
MRKISSRVAMAAVPALLCNLLIGALINLTRE